MFLCGCGCDCDVALHMCVCINEEDINGDGAIVNGT